MAGLVTLFALLALFITFDPGIQTAAIAVTVGVFNVVGVLLTTNHTGADLGKAVTALQASALALAAFFITLDPTTVESIGAIVTAVVNVYGVYKATNEPALSRF